MESKPTMRLRKPETFGDFADWLNNWGDEDRHSHSQWGEWRQQIWRDGYEQAMRDANKHFNRIYPEWREFDLG